MSASTKPLSTKPARFMSKLELRGTQLAGWTPTTTSPPLAGGILFDENVEIALPDGTVLKGDLFRPAGAGRVPVLISWAVYIKDTERMGAIFIDESGICDHVIKQGYAELRVQPRGTGASGGVAGLSRCDRMGRRAGLVQRRCRDDRDVRLRGGAAGGGGDEASTS